VKDYFFLLCIIIKKIEELLWWFISAIPTTSGKETSITVQACLNKNMRPCMKNKLKAKRTGGRVLLPLHSTFGGVLVW
jgi:hypothetical protein